MKTLFKLMIPLLVVLLNACTEDGIIRSEFTDGPAPQANFTYSQNFLEVTFQSTSTDAESYYWDFGDGTTSTESSPVHTYAASGTYDVVLKVNSEAGYSSFSEKASIYVAGAAVPFFTYTPISELGFNFDASNSSNIKSAKWDFGDGSPEMEDIIVTHEFPDFGIYQVTLYVTGLLDDVAVFELPVTVGGPIVPSFTHTPGLGYVVNFDASQSENIKSAKWDFGDGSPEADGITITHTFPADGTYQVKLTATGVLGDVEELIIPIDVVANYNLLKGSDMEASASAFWSSYPIVHSGTWTGSLTFGYSDDKPTAGSGGCLQIHHPANASVRIFIWQAVNVESGKKYRYSANIKLPGGVRGNYFRFLTSTALQTTAPYAGYPFSNTSPVFIECNNESATTNWQNPSFAYDGDLSATWMTGSGRYNGGSQGIFTASHTGVLYVGFGLYNTNSGTPVTILVDDVKFELEP